MVDMGLLIDPLSISFALLITGVGSLIHIYSIGYMSHDPDRRRFFAYLNLFVAAMLLLVLSDNYVGLFIGWEGVGLASYLLIGFWQFKPSAAVAAKKAFVVNRVGDFGLLVGMFIIWTTFSTLTFSEVSAAVAGARRLAGRDHRHRPAAAPRRLRQVRPAPAAVLAAGRDGGPDPGLRPHPRRDHGHRRRLPGGPLGAVLRGPPASPRWSSPSSASPRCSPVRSSVVPRTTSRRAWPARRCRRSVT